MPRSNLVTLAFAWAKVQIMYYFKTIAAIGLKVGLNIQINELMKLVSKSRSLFDLGQRSLSFQSQGHCLTLAKGHSDFKIKSCFSQEILSQLEPNLK